MESAVLVRERTASAVSLASDGGELAALLSARRWVVVVVTLVSVVTFTLSLPIQLGDVPTAQRVMVAVMWALAVAGMALSSRPIGLWVLTIAALVLSLISVTGSQLWTQFMPLVAVFEVALFVVVLSPRLVGVIAVLLSASFLLVLPGDQAVVVELGPWAITTGGVRGLQLLLAGGFLAYAWPGMVRRARESDVRRDTRQRELDLSLSSQERTRVWRDTAIKVHETILNDIRYVLTADALDGDRLRSQLGRRPSAGRLDVLPAQSLGQLIEAAVAESRLASRVQLDVPDVPLDPEVAPYARAAVIEVLRNVDRHGTRATVTLSGRIADGSACVTCRSEIHPGSQGSVDPAGIGRAIVLEEALSSIGGRVEVDRDGVTLVLPLTVSAADPRQDLRADPGRVAASGVLAGVAAGAFPYPLALLGTGSAHLAWAGVITLGVLAASVFTALRRPRIPVPAIAILGMLGFAVPALMWVERDVCVQATSLAYIVDITGFALVAIIVWSPWRSALLAVVPWAVAATAFVLASPPVACEPIPLIALVASVASVFAGLLMAGVLRWSIPRSRRRADASRRLEEARVQEAARAEAALDMARTLDASVTAAWDVMQDVARRGSADESSRATLRRMEARIRATIQVDPHTSGAVTQLARELVMLTSAQGRSVQVLSLRDSQDRRPLPGPLRDQLQAFLLGSDIEPSIQAFAHSGMDHLTVVGSAQACEAAGLTVGQTRGQGGVHIEVLDTGQSDGAVTVMVTRAS